MTTRPGSDKEVKFQALRQCGIALLMQAISMP
jgi:hypothetical protein